MKNSLISFKSLENPPTSNAFQNNPTEQTRQQLLEYCKLDTLAELQIVQELRRLMS